MREPTPYTDKVMTVFREVEDRPKNDLARKFIYGLVFRYGQPSFSMLTHIDHDLLSNLR